MELKDLGAMIDALYAAREERLNLDRKIKEMKSNEEDLRMAILEMLDTAGLAKASGHAATASIRSSLVPHVEDWDSVYDYVTDTGRFDLLQKRLSVVAWRDLNESGELVPGTVAITDTDISLTKSARN